MAVRQPNPGKKPNKTHSEKENKNNYKNSENPPSLMQSSLKWILCSQDSRPVRYRHYGMDKPLVLERSIKRRTVELLDSKETMAEIHRKGVEAAEKKEKDFKDASAVIMKRSEKDKNLDNFVKCGH